MLELKLIHVSKRGPWSVICTSSQAGLLWETQSENNGEIL